MVGIHGGGLRFVARDVLSEKERESTRTVYQGFTLDGPLPGIVTLTVGKPHSAERGAPSEIEASEDADALFRSIYKVGAEMDRLGEAALAAFAETPAPPMPRLYSRLAMPFTTWPTGYDVGLMQRLAQWMEDADETVVDTTFPASYTYLGQFIAHDISYRRPAPRWPIPVVPGSDALDLSSIFDPPPFGCEPSSVFDCSAAADFGSTHGFCLGQTTMDRHDDIPRSSNGRPCLADYRNDNNMLVGQFTATVIKFCRRVAELCDGDEVATRRLARRHVQSMVLHDFLGTITDPDIHREVLEHGRGYLHPNGVPADFKLPNEFSAACFRFGHSVVRGSYDVNTEFKGALLSDLLNRTHLANPTHPYSKLEDRWVIDWTLLHPLDPYVAHRTANPIDLHVTYSLRNLRSAWYRDLAPDLADDLEVSLAEITLRRGLGFNLPHGAAMVGLVDTALTQNPLNDGSPRMLASPPDAKQFNIWISNRVDGIAHDAADAALLKSHVPLWLYVLLEAEYLGESKRLGPLASRIVAETLHATIQASADSIVDANQNIVFDPDPRLVKKGATHFTLSDMLRLAGERKKT